MTRLSHRKAIVAEGVLNRHLERAFATALRLYGCVECAEKEIVRRIAKESWSTTLTIMGDHPFDEDQPNPTEPDRIRILCDISQNPCARSQALSHKEIRR